MNRTRSCVNATIRPVYTGMNLAGDICGFIRANLPRMYGDEPMEGTGCTVVGESVPYARGCISQIANPIIPQDDLPHIHGDEPHRTRPD